MAMTLGVPLLFMGWVCSTPESAIALVEKETVARECIYLDTDGVSVLPLRVVHLNERKGWRVVVVGTLPPAQWANFWIVTGLKPIGSAL